MRFQKYLEKLKSIQENILGYLDSEENIEENFQNLKIIIDYSNINEDRHDLKLVLQLIVKISNNHHRGLNFFAKIERILQEFTNSISKYLTNSEIYNIFKSNKRILLFLFKENILIMDKNIYCQMLDTKYNLKGLKYKDYFSPEISSFCKSDKKHKENLDSNSFENKRQIGENDDYICTTIQTDLVKEFISFTNKNNVPLNNMVNPSIFETNRFLQNKDVSLIEYVTFFGSIQIFQYMQINGVSLNSSLWKYAVFGQNAEIIHLLEDNHIEPIDKSYDDCLIQSIKCHHNDIVNYISDNFISGNSNDNTSYFIKYYNFLLFPNEFDYKSFFFDFVIYNYYNIVEIFLNETDVNVNQAKVFNRFLAYQVH